jgi:hypothetical protein
MAFLTASFDQLDGLERSIRHTDIRLCYLSAKSDFIKHLVCDACYDSIHVDILYLVACKLLNDDFTGHKKAIDYVSVKEVMGLKKSFEHVSLTSVRERTLGIKQRQPLRSRVHTCMNVLIGYIQDLLYHIKYSNMSLIQPKSSDKYKVPTLILALCDVLKQRQLTIHSNCNGVNTGNLRIFETLAQLGVQGKTHTCGDMGENSNSIEVKELTEEV